MLAASSIKNTLLCCASRSLPCISSSAFDKTLEVVGAATTAVAQGGVTAMLAASSIKNTLLCCASRSLPCISSSAFDKTLEVVGAATTAVAQGGVTAIFSCSYFYTDGLLFSRVRGNGVIFSMKMPMTFVPNVKMHFVIKLPPPKHCHSCGRGKTGEDRYHRDYPNESNFCSTLPDGNMDLEFSTNHKLRADS